MIPAEEERIRFAKQWRALGESTDLRVRVLPQTREEQGSDNSPV
jgi:hypothetical protein